MADLAGLKVKIGLRANGSAKYPNFNQLLSVQSSGMDWSTYVDRQGTGWIYDKVGHDEEDAPTSSPRGMQWGILICPEQFVDEAVAAFPSECTRMTETEVETFYDTRQKNLVEEEVDVEELQSLERQWRLIKEIESEPGPPASIGARKSAVLEKMKKAIDPADEAKGVRQNPRRNYQAYKALLNITFLDPP